MKKSGSFKTKLSDIPKNQGHLQKLLHPSHLRNFKIFYLFPK